MDKKAGKEEKDTMKQLPPTGQNRSTLYRRIWPLIATLLALTVVLKLDLPPPGDYAVCSELSRIYTVDPLQPKVQCVVVRDSHVLDVGDLESVQKRWKDQSSAKYAVWPLDLLLPGLRTIRLDTTSAVVPGLADAHAHILLYGYKMNLNLDACTSVDEIISRLKAYVVSHPGMFNDPSRWIEGMGWDQTKWPDAIYPTADDFDNEPLLRGRFISLTRIDGHASWVSNRVIQNIGTIPDKVGGGAIIRNSRGKPTGIFVDNAMSLIHTPPWSQSQMEEYFNRAIDDGLSYGLTSVHDAEAEPHMIEFFTKYAESKELPIRLYVMGKIHSNEYWGSKIPRLLNHGIGGRLNLRSIKLVADGALGSFGAALLSPYSDNPSTSGLMLQTPSILFSLVSQFWEDGWQVNIHCIGDRANKVVLDIFENLLDSGNYSVVSERRPRIEHAQIMTLDDLGRVGKLGVIPSVQPTHATSDMWYAEQRLGPERIKGAYAYRTLLESSQNHVLPLGSDFPVEGINPLLGFYAAITRLSERGDSPHGPGGWYPEERLTREQALKGMTLDAAYASFAEDTIGSLAIGKKADFVVLSQDIMSVPEEEILNARVLATVIDGKVVYGKL